MTQEQKELLKELIGFRYIAPLDQEKYEKRELNNYRTEAINSIRRYKDLKFEISERKKRQQEIKDLLKAIDEIK